MALKKDAVDNFFNISQNHATAQKIAKQTIAIAENNPIIKVSDSQNTNPTQTLHNLNTNLTQTSHNLNTNLTQTSHKPHTIPHTKLNMEPHTNLTQTSHKHIFSTLLYGNLKKVMLHIYNQCKFNGTHEIIVSIGDISNHTKIAIGSINTTLTRLEQKGFISRLFSQGGKGGWKKIRINEQKYQEMLYLETLHKPHTNLTQTSHKPHTIPHTIPHTTSSSSSNIYNKTTTTSEAENLSLGGLGEEWLEIDIEPLEKINFTKTHLTQIATQEKLTPQLVQESIYAFAFDLENNKRRESIKGDPLNYFMGILRIGKPYAPPSNYESPQDRAMRYYSERMREIEQNRLKMKEEAMNLAFNEWFNQLTSDQKLQFLPKILRKSAKLGKSSRMLEESARAHFETEVWPERLAEILNNNHNEIPPNPKWEGGDEEQTIEQ